LRKESWEEMPAEEGESQRKTQKRRTKERRTQNAERRTQNAETKRERGAHIYLRQKIRRNGMNLFLCALVGGQILCRKQRKRKAEEGRRRRRRSSGGGGGRSGKEK
jgi:hypothetical protein